MIDSDILESIFASGWLFALLVGGVVLALWAALRSLRVRLLHPFAYFFYFNTGVAYAVAFFFALRFDTNAVLYGYVLVCAVLTIAFLRLGFERGEEARSFRFVETLGELDARGVFLFAAFASAALLAVFAASGVNTISSESRFASAAGMGLLVRAVEASTIIAMCFGAVVAARSESRALVIGALLFAASAVFVAGSKGGVLEAFLWFVFLSERVGRRVPYGRIAVGAVLALIAFAGVLYFNLEARGIDPLAFEGQFSELPLIVEMMLARIIGNGDIYYFTLPPGVEEHVSRALAYGPLQLVFQVLGASSGAPFGVDVHANEAGRQAYLYWYPDAPMGGPANHLDIGFYFYLGPVLGAAAVSLVAYAIGWLHGAITKSTGYTAKVAVLAVLYSRLLIAIPGPSIALQRLVDVLAVLSIIFVLFRLREGTVRESHV